MAERNTQPSGTGRAGHNFQDSTAQGNARAHYGDVNPRNGSEHYGDINTYKDNRVVYVTFNNYGSCSHERETVKVSAAAAPAPSTELAKPTRSAGKAERPAQRRRQRPESEPGTESSAEEDGVEDEEATHGARRARLIFTKPLTKRDERLVSIRLEEAGYDSDVQEESVQKVKAEMARQSTLNAMSGIPARPEGRDPDQTAYAPGGPAGQSPPAQTPAAKMQTEQHGQRPALRSGAHAHTSQQANRSRAPVRGLPDKHNASSTRDENNQRGTSAQATPAAEAGESTDKTLEWHPKICEVYQRIQNSVDFTKISRVDLDALRQLPPERRAQQLLLIVYRQDKRKYDALRNAIRQNAGGNAGDPSDEDE